MQLEVRERIGELSADFFTDAEVKRALNEAQRRFSSEDRWPWLYTELDDQLNEGDETYALPENISIGRAFNVSISGPTLARARTLERVDPQAGFRMRFGFGYPETPTPGAPRYYYLTSGSEDGDDNLVYTIRFLPGPDADYDISAQYLRRPIDMSADGDEADCPDEYAEAVIAWAAGKLFLKEISISNKAQEQFAIYSKVVDQARNDVIAINQDETVAWGREHPGELYRGWPPSIYDRLGTRPLGP